MIEKLFLKMKSISCIFFLLVFILFSKPISTKAQIESFEDSNGGQIQRSLESLRDLDYQNWQLVVYPKTKSNGHSILRIVGFKGSLRIDHPTNLIVSSGIKSWSLEDITLNNPQLAIDNRDAAVEFSLDKLLNDLDNNRPLRLALHGGVEELPIPPYVVSEWRSVNKSNLIDGD